MATSGNFSNYGYAGYSNFGLYVTWSASQSTSGNYSDVTIKAYVKAYTLNCVAKPLTITAFGTTKTLTSKAISKTSQSWSNVLLGETTIRVSHNNDGTKSGSISVKWDCAVTYSGTYVASMSASKSSISLTTIPRASSFGTISGNTIGSSITVNINRNSDSFTHSLWYSFGSLTWQSIGSGIGTSKAFTPPLSICSQIPNATSGTMTLILRTFNGSTQIGSDVTKTITVYVPSSVVPSISSVAISEANTSVVPSSWGVYVQNKSKLKFVTSSSGSNGSTISSVKVDFNNSSYTGGTVTTGIITNSGTLTATITVTDSRGRTAKTTKSVTVQAYSNPYVTSISAIRCDSNGNSNANGTYTKISIIGGVSSISGKNTYSYQIKYKKTTDSTYTVHTITNNSNTINTNVILSGFDTNYSYDIVGVVSDYFTSSSKNTTLSTAFVTIDYLNGGKGIAFGKVAEKNGFEVEMNTYMNKKLILADSPPHFGGCRYTTLENSYVRLFSLEMSVRWKHVSIWFTLVDTQGDNENLLCNLFAHYGDASTAWINVRHLKYLTFNSFDNSRLVAVVTSNNTIEVYIKMKVADSPTINIISMTKHIVEEDNYGKITIDCETTTTSLPSGTTVTSSGTVFS